MRQIHVVQAQRLSVVKHCAQKEAADVVAVVDYVGGTTGLRRPYWLRCEGLGLCALGYCSKTTIK